MGSVGWDDMAVTEDPARPGRFLAEIAPRWMLTVVPQGGAAAVLAARAMTAALARGDQAPRSVSIVFAGPVGTGPVEIDVAVLRRGRSMSQLTATVRNPGAPAGLTAVAVFGTPRRGFAFTEVAPPAVPGPDGLPSYRDEPPDGIEGRRPMPFWDEVLEARPAQPRPWWEPHGEGPAELATWYRLDDPPLLDDGRLDPLAALVVCDTMPGAVARRVPAQEGAWFAPSADLTVHLLGAAEPGWLLGHKRARHAGDGYASAEMTLWDPVTGCLVAYATQMMFFSFDR